MKEPSTSAEDMLSFYKSLAQERGGKCLSNKYTNNKSKLNWRCAEGHEWEALPQNIRKGHWCQICGNLRQGRQKAKSIETAQELARAKEGECLSSAYMNNHTKLLWRCAHGHEWQAVPASIQSGSWCPICAGKLLPEDALLALQQHAKKLGGACLSEEYRGAKTKLRWKCAEGHEWMAIPDSVRRGTWCPHCGGSMLLSLAVMHETARAIGGECLSTSYVNSDEKLRWRCSEGHEWEAVAYHVRAGHWCPTCAAGNSERICKNIFEQMFGKPFPKVKPRWLLNARGKKMELDGYCDELKLGFEYHGAQHYEHVEFFHQGGKSLERRKCDDELKVGRCLEHGVYLIVIPYTVPMGDVPQYVYQAAKALGIAVPLKRPEQVNVAEFVLPERIAEMQRFAEQKGGKCLSTAYVNNNTKLRWRCAEGHEWEAVAGSIQQGSWCPACAGRRQPDDALRNLQEIAQAKGGSCLSDLYSEGRIKLRWRCAVGHEWNAPPNNIRGGSWCPVCAKKTMGGKRLGLRVCQEAAIAKGGECLSNEYVNTDTKLRWRCAEGHVWETTPYSVVNRGCWCPRCKGKRIWETRRKNKAAVDASCRLETDDI